MFGLEWAVWAAGMEVVVLALVAEAEGVWLGLESLKTQNQSVTTFDQNNKLILMLIFCTVFVLQVLNIGLLYGLYIYDKNKWNIFWGQQQFPESCLTQTSIVPGRSIILRRRYRSTVLHEKKAKATIGVGHFLILYHLLTWWLFDELAHVLIY